MQKFNLQLLCCLALVCGLFSLSARTTLGPEYQEPDIGWLEDWASTVPGGDSARTTQDQGDLRF